MKWYRFIETELWRLRIIVLVTLGVLAYLPFHAFISTWGGSVIGPLLVWKSAKDIIITIVTVILVVWCLVDPIRRRWLTQDRLVQLFVVFAFVGMCVTVAFADRQSPATLAGIIMGLRYGALFMALYIIGRWIGVGQQWIVKGLLLIGVFLVAAGLMQVTIVPSNFLEQFGYNKQTTISPVTLIDDNPDARRAFATLRGPNDYGAFLIVVLMAVLVWQTRTRVKISLGLFVALGLFLSGSRSAWLGAVVAVGVWLAVAYGRSLWQHKKVRYGLVGVVGMLVIGLFAATTIPALRLAVFHSSPDDTHLTEGSTDDHWKATANGIIRVVNNPLGCGFGCAGPASFYSHAPKISENYYVQIAEETGMVGLALWLGWFIMVMKQLYRVRRDQVARLLFASGGGIAVVAMLLHVWNDDPLSLMWWGLAGLVLGNISRLGYDKTKHETKIKQTVAHRANH